jgi:hypothetical protein
VVVPDQRDLAAVLFEAVTGQGGDLVRSPAGVAQQHVGGLIHRPQISGRERGGPIDRPLAQRREVGVELGDDRLGNRATGFVVMPVTVVTGPGMSVAVAHERGA